MARIEPMEQPRQGPGKKTLAGVVGAGAAAILLVLVPQWEGYRPTPYRDVTKIWTVCFGDTVNVVPGRTETREQCEARLERQLIAHAEPVLRCTPSLAGHDDQLAAATSLAYNVGVTAYCRSTVARRFNAGDWRGACDAFLAWRFAGGREIRGLLNRRRAERDICLRGL